jgi:DNA transformation protein
MSKRVDRILPFRDSGSPSGSLDGLVNIGPKSAAWLAAAGIDSIERLREVGSIGACRKLLEDGRPVSVLMAYAIEGALQGIHWNALDAEIRRSLVAEFARTKRSVRAAQSLRAAAAVAQL